MERDIWKRITKAINRIKPTRLRNEVYTNREILAVLLWASLYGRPISWACKRPNWPKQAWRRRLPDQSTMSRRLRHRDIAVLQRRVMSLVQEDGSDATMIAIIDGKALQLSENTRDPDARTGRGVGGYAKGYKLHALIDDQWRVLAWRVRPLNVAECLVAQDLLRDAARSSIFKLVPRTVVLGDASYDSNRLHLLAAQVGGIGIAPGANINYDTGHAIFEATHGTAPKYAGLDKVNPGSVILSGEMMLRYMGWEEAADLIIQGIDGAIGAKTVTYDFERLMEDSTLVKCSGFADAIIEHMGAGVTVGA